MLLWKVTNCCLVFSAIKIGFESDTYNVRKDPTTALTYNNGPVFFVKEDGQISEQTFMILVQASGSTVPGTDIQPASINDDYQLLFSSNTSVVISFPPSAQRVPFGFTILQDSDPEETEAFLASSEPYGAPTYLNPTSLFAETLITISSRPRGEPSA